MQKLITGRDGQTRGAVLRVTNKSRRYTTLQRPVQRIYPLGVTQSVTQDEPEAVDSARKPEPEAGKREAELPTRPQRESALRGRDRVRAWTSQLMEDEEHG